MIKTKRLVDGILLLNKALNVSSNTALQQVKRVFNAKKAGHTGSLDPLASGVLPICLGEAAKFSQYLLDADKTYTVWGRLGCTTITGDAEGEVHIVENAPIISKQLFEEALEAFYGPIHQVPPMYSALKKEGVPLYELARKGIEVERKSRLIHIYNITLNAYKESSSAITDFEITVHCSKGTYIRTLVEDIGKYLHSGAYLLNLRRDKAGPYALASSYTLENLQEIAEKNLESLDALLLPPDSAVSHFPALHLDESQSKMLQQGKIVDLIRMPDFSSTEDAENLFRLFNEKKEFFGLGKISSDGQLRVKRLINLQ